MIVVLGHATSVNGKVFEAPVNTLTETLVNHKEDFIHIRHSLDGKMASTAYHYQKGVLVLEKKLKVHAKISILRYVSEIWATYFYLSRLENAKELVLVAADPLNALSAVLLKNKGKIKKAIFYTVDYSTKRFENPVLNGFYQKIDKYCCRKADMVWNVSSRIYALRKSMGVPDKKNIFIPNMPSGDYVEFVKNTRQKHTLVTLGILGDQLDFENLFLAVKELSAEIPDLKLLIAGDGPKKEDFVALVAELGIKKQVEFLGYISHKEALDAISKSGVGLALYNGNWSFNHYGDSMKCREFFCFGLPVLTTDTHSTADDIREKKVGEVVEMGKDEYAKALKTIFASYDAYAKNSLALSKEFEDVHWKNLQALS